MLLSVKFTSLPVMVLTRGTLACDKAAVAQIMMPKT